MWFLSTKQAKSMRLEFFTFLLLIGFGIPLVLMIILWRRKTDLLQERGTALGAVTRVPS